MLTLTQKSLDFSDRINFGHNMALNLRSPYISSMTMCSLRCNWNSLLQTPDIDGLIAVSQSSPSDIEANWISAISPHTHTHTHTHMHTYIHTSVSFPTPAALGIINVFFHHSPSRTGSTLRFPKKLLPKRLFNTMHFISMGKKKATPSLIWWQLLQMTSLTSTTHTVV